MASLSTPARCAAITVLLLAVVAATAGSVWAWFTATDDVAGTISTGTWSSAISLAPGQSKAVRWDGVQPVAFPVADLDEAGELRLDFGEVGPRVAGVFPDVIRVTSEQPLDRHLGFRVSGTIAPFITRIGLRGVEDDLLAAGAQESIQVGITAPRASLPGNYDGFLTILVEGQDEPAAVVPLLVTVRRGAAMPALPLRPVAVKQAPRTAPKPDESAGPEPPADTRSYAGLCVRPGESRAVTPDPFAEDLPAAVRIGADGRLRIRLGAAAPGTTVEWADLLRLEAVGSRATVTVRVTGEVAKLGFTVSVLPAVRLDPGTPAKVALRLELPADAHEGVYRGALVLRLQGPDELALPLRLTVTGGAEAPVIVEREDGPAPSFPPVPLPKTRSTPPPP